MLQYQLQSFIITGASFEWDDNNRYKNLIKHGVTEEEAESVFLDKQLILTWSFHIDSCEKRLIAIGKSRLSRHLLLVFTVRSNKNSSDLCSKNKRKRDTKV